MSLGPVTLATTADHVRQCGPMSGARRYCRAANVKVWEKHYPFSSERAGPTSPSTKCLPNCLLDSQNPRSPLSRRSLATGRRTHSACSPLIPSVSISSWPICFRQLFVYPKPALSLQVDFATMVQAQMPGASTDVMATGMTAALERRLER